MTRLLGLTFLAPKTLEAILNLGQGPGVTLLSLMEGVAVEREVQRRQTR